MSIGNWEEKEKYFPLPPCLLKIPDVVKMAFGDGLVRV
jgi:hypothetical protein